MTVTDPGALVGDSTTGGSAAARGPKELELRVHPIERGGCLPRDPQNPSTDEIACRERPRSSAPAAQVNA